MATQVQQKERPRFRGTDLLGNGISEKTLKEFGFNWGEPITISYANGLIRVSTILKNEVPAVPATLPQLKLARQLILERVVSEDEREQRLQSLNEMTKREASIAIARLLNNA